MGSVVVLLITDLLSSAFCVQSTVTEWWRRWQNGRQSVHGCYCLSFQPKELII